MLSGKRLLEASCPPKCLSLPLVPTRRAGEPGWKLVVALESPRFLASGRMPTATYRSTFNGVQFPMTTIVHKWGKLGRPRRTLTISPSAKPLHPQDRHRCRTSRPSRSSLRSPEPLERAVSTLVFDRTEQALLIATSPSVEGTISNSFSS